MNKKLLPVIHFKDLKTTEYNVKMCIEAQCAGVFIINMDCESTKLNSALYLAKNMGGHNFFVGVNRLGVDNKALVYHISSDQLVDGYWVDNPGISSLGTKECTIDLAEICDRRKIMDPDFKFYGSVAFKTQKVDPNPVDAAILAKGLNWIPTTSGSATGVPADLEKIKSMKKGLGNYPLAIASGITPENVDLYLPYVDHFLVATGISKDFYNFDINKLNSLSTKINNYD